MKSFKITKIRSFRFNFEADGKHYSIQEADEWPETILCLRCKEDKNAEIDVECGCIPAVFYYSLKRRPGCYKDYIIDIPRINKTFGTNF